MKVLSRLVPAAAAAMAVAAFAAPAASASTESHHSFPGADNAVFVQTDNLSGNSVAAYNRASNGTLTLAATYPTGGVGGQLTGSVVDHLASQGSLTYDQDRGLLYAVNAGSNTVSVFAVSGDHLALRQVISSGGSFPVSVTVHGDLVYVLNALNGGSVYGYRVNEGRLSPIPGSLRARPQPERDAAVHQHAGAGRVHARRVGSHRHDQGQRQRRRRVRGRPGRAPFVLAGGEL